jgi:hypothetical protein
MVWPTLACVYCAGFAARLDSATSSVQAVEMAAILSPRSRISVILVLSWRMEVVLFTRVLVMSSISAARDSWKAASETLLILAACMATHGMSVGCWRGAAAAMQLLQ